MTRAVGVVGLAAVAVGGYLAGRYEEELRGVLERALNRTEPEQFGPPRRPSYGTEYDHLEESELAERHRIAEEIKRHPLRERSQRGLDEESDTVAPQPHKRDVDEYRYPKSY